MIYHHGFLDDDLRFIPARDASPEMLETGLFHSWYEMEKEAPPLREALLSAIASLPGKFALLSGGGILDSAVESLAAAAGKSFEIIRIGNEMTEESRAGALHDWVTEHRFRYFLTDPAQAAILYRAWERLRTGVPVVLAGPLPILKDLNWQLTGGRTPPEIIASPTPNWVVVDRCRNASPFLMRHDFPHLVPNLMFEAGIFRAYLHEFDFRSNGGLLRALGIRELIRGDLLGRWLAPEDFLGKNPVHPKTRFLPVISRPGRHGTCYSRLETYTA